MRLVGEQRAADRRLREPNEATNPIFTATFDFDVTSNDVVSNPPL
jgi:hypothetical protein